MRIAINKVVDGQNENAGFVQSAARKAAKAAGDVNVGINLVKGANFRLKHVASPVGLTFTLTAIGGGAVDIDTKAPGDGAVYIRRYALVSGENIVPKKEDIRELEVSREGSTRTERMQVGEWYAFSEATIMPIPKPRPNSGNTNQAPTQAEEKSTQTISSTTRRRIFIDSEESNYNYGPWLWILVR